MFLKKHNQGILALIIANIIWGAASPIFKWSLQNITPFTLAYWRFAVAALLLFPFCWNHLNFAKKDLPKFILLALSGVFFNITFFFFGLKYAPSVNAPVISSSAPIFLYLFAIFILHEKAKLKILLGTLISFLGVFVIVIQPLLNGQGMQLILGNIFFLLATIGNVIQVIICKDLLKKYKPVTITFWSFIIGSIAFLPFYLYEVFKYDPLHHLNINGISGLVFGIFLSSLAAYFLYAWGMEKIKAQEVGLFTYIDPLIAGAIATPLLGEEITLVFLLGAILIFAGIYVAEGRLHYHPLHKLIK
ncbi:hypothetical protein A3D03_06030 [Candidatus Gottesmanbacteria bacterium RIFCSPHIGHO2_02_FULL_40_13]|uniref:EamA domain-containing protein n=1 Tax=Candidatus Gottesmanbacteria bacterium RIFCSPHIGHO2_02_FULL_40_13 TaxID=1798384 RepID=A0A1F6A6V5_9BACT|nr:MAG: hypothetical protein A3D03_06030 [Candidatus Gottesmanbacteria bacterium RIFCSPHIGHO2_02_FULL_40_13]